MAAYVLSANAAILPWKKSHNETAEETNDITTNISLGTETLMQQNDAFLSQSNDYTSLKDDLEVKNISRPPEAGHEGFAFWVVGGTLGTVVFATLAGNGIVIYAVLHDRALRSAHHNRLNLSLAVTDFLVGLIVMPMAISVELYGSWIFPIWACYVWTFSDVLLCTSSIMHLVAIAVDRYLAVTQVAYARSRPAWVITVMIHVVWILSATIAVAPFVAWRDPMFETRIVLDGYCVVPQVMWYQVSAAVASFFIPMVALFWLYNRILRVIQNQIRNGPGSASRQTGGGQRAVLINENSQAHSGESEAIELEQMEDQRRPRPSRFLLARQANVVGTEGGRPSREAMEAARELRAITVLVLITGIFALCWTPFFVVVLITQPEPGFEISEFWSVVVLWLGYCNSALNPILYSIFSPDYRKAFHDMIWPPH